ncbi:MAG: FAD-dependent oxidoreductase [Chloroflexi bacterium]|nr:FAD-dependent oxidoreductase [Chloroflexota bacterium]
MNGTETTADVVVIGAGAVGCACAYFLAGAGMSVLMLDQEGIASGASTHATGSFSLLASDFKTEPHLRLGIESYRLTRDMVPALEDESGVKVLYQRRPSLRLALDAVEEDLIRSSLEWQRELLPAWWIDGNAARRLEPRLTAEVRGAAYEDESAQLDSAQFTRALAAAAEQRGAQILLRQVSGLVKDGDRVIGVRHTRGEISANAVVLAMGPWAAAASAWMNFEVPVRPLKGERLLLQFDGPPLSVLISSPKRGHMISRLDGFLSVGSTAGRDFDDQEVYLRQGFDVRPTTAALEELIQRAVEVLPDVVNASVAQHLAGVRPLTPDRQPLIGPVPGYEGVYLATGHGTKGIHLAVVTGRIIADLLTRGSTDLSVPVQAFTPARFMTAVTADSGPRDRRLAD